MKTQYDGTPKMIIKYSVTDAGIEELREQYGEIEPVENPAGLKKLKGDITVITKIRTSVESTRKNLKRDSVEYGRRVDAEAKRITAKLLGVETPMRAERARYEAIVEAERAEKARLEAERIAVIQARIDEIAGLASTLVDAPASEIAAAMKELDTDDDDGFDFEELSERYTAVVEMAYTSLCRLHTAAETREREAAETKERERLAAIERAKQAEEAEAERQRVAEERAAMEADREKQEWEREKAKLAREEQEDKANHERIRMAEKQADLDAEREKQAEERERAKAERAALESERRLAEEAEREREIHAAAAREQLEEDRRRFEAEKEKAAAVKEPEPEPEPKPKKKPSGKMITCPHCGKDFEVPK